MHFSVFSPAKKVTGFFLVCARDCNLKYTPRCIFVFSPAKKVTGFFLVCARDCNLKCLLRGYIKVQAKLLLLFIFYYNVLPGLDY